MEQLVHFKDTSKNSLYSLLFVKINSFINTNFDRNKISKKDKKHLNNNNYMRTILYDLLFKLKKK